MPELEPLYTAEEMRAAEARYPGFPETSPELMERAGAQVAGAALELFSAAQRWTVVCGGGSNGGDGRIAARHLEEAGREVRIVDAKAHRLVPALQDRPAFRLGAAPPAPLHRRKIAEPDEHAVLGRGAG